MSKQTFWEEFEKKKDRWQLMEKEMRVKLLGTRSFWWLYRMYHRLKDVKSEVYYWYQRQTRGFDDTEIWNLDSSIIKFVYPRLKYFVKWQSEHGMGTPHDFEQNPAGWLEALNSMDRAFTHMAAEEYLLGEENYPHRPNEGEFRTDEEYYRARDAWDVNSEIAEKEKKEGLALFAKYFENLWD